MKIAFLFYNRNCFVGVRKGFTVLFYVSASERRGFTVLFYVSAGERRGFTALFEASADERIGFTALFYGFAGERGYQTVMYPAFARQRNENAVLFSDIACERSCFTALHPAIVYLRRDKSDESNAVGNRRSALANTPTFFILSNSERRSRAPCKV